MTTFIAYIIIFSAAYGILAWGLNDFISPIFIILVLLMINLLVSKVSKKTKSQ